jgi:hypothetical protein
MKVFCVLGFPFLHLPRRFIDMQNKASLALAHHKTEENILFHYGHHKSDRFRALLGLPGTIVRSSWHTKAQKGQLFTFDDFSPSISSVARPR